ncbi:hypothetical protein DL766_003455 [Monosporascus sp. MC13-8B]|uniref:Rhodopsin domain-containing protein n=1 Tax=Monosporascus cannonballus TaxID=155416 RepID=A0ABY0H9L1_9PEZI|nr:hypothetical protein DL762_003792 [Monosporascus cannonballus]RYO93537.1 hypothetical protein DL763_004333 [Monosporascus cannonballus]RYP33424.1 hypothetical protein DL766_003455 [Monosporascus sp. MC13-8B]
MATLTPPDPLPPDENVGPTLVALSSVLGFLALLTGSLRLYVRFAQHNAGWDDYLMVVLLPIATMRLVVQGVQLHYGNGRHRWYISQEDYVTNNMLGWYAQHMLFLGMCILKCSIMFLLLRIKDTRNLRWLLGGIMVVLVITSLGCSIILLSECKPISAYWTGVGVCWDVRIRIYWIYVTIWRAMSLGIQTTDLSYVFARVAIWSNLELFLGIIAANLALTRQIYVYVFSRQDLQSNKSTTYGAGSGRTGPSYPSIAKYGFASRLRGDRTENGTTFVATGMRRDSGDSGIPLEPVIQKTTEFWISEDGLRKDGRAGGSRETMSPAVSPA